MPDQNEPSNNQAPSLPQVTWSDLRRLECLVDLLEQASIPLHQVTQLLIDASRLGGSEIGKATGLFQKSFGSMFSEFSHLQQTVGVLHTLGQAVIHNTTSTPPRSGSTESTTSAEQQPADSSTAKPPRSASDAPSGEKSDRRLVSDMSELMWLIRHYQAEARERQEAEEIFQGSLPHLHGPDSGL